MSSSTASLTVTADAELVFVPAPGMGHLKSAVELAKLIIQRNHRISIVILIINIPTTTSLINDFIHSQSRNNPYPTHLTFITLPPLSNPPERSSPEFMRILIELHEPLVKQAVEERIQAGSSKLAGFVLDMFCTNMIDIATNLNVPAYIFFTSGANMLSLMFHFQSMNDEGVFDLTKDHISPNAEFDVPGFVNRVPEKVLPAVLIDKESGVPMLLNLVRGLRRSKGILVNSFTELETSGVQALLDQATEGGSIPAIYPVGPILELDSGSQGEDHVSILQWLDKQPSSSVVFLCFGSMGSFDANEVKEIANGLEKSGHRFLWSLRKPPSAGTTQSSQDQTFVEALPEGFVDRTAKIGKIISWAPQVSILSHPSVGGFVSHCGWNSTLESMWFGVPVATWPLHAEQQLNAFELIKELGLAVEIRMDYRHDWKTRKANFVVTAEEVENGVQKLMSLDEETKKRVRQMRDEGRKALEDGGSSHMSLARFIQDVLTFE
ncbi:hypothetical protein BVRB_6g138360 [Beta vulgaris subsp. vulgaris]|nr:hypothetical protein BVRB_6g138360 [Beta vulgaris subsp. vulgaris]